jgi:hypothetical protein
LLTFTQDEAQPDEATSLVAVVGITAVKVTFGKCFALAGHVA